MVPFMFSSNEVLFVVDVHRDFKTKTDVAVFWSFPFHRRNPHIKLIVRVKLMFLLYIVQIMCHI
jgi:hypothetical protein